MFWKYFIEKYKNCHLQICSKGTWTITRVKYYEKIFWAWDKFQGQKWMFIE